MLTNYCKGCAQWKTDQQSTFRYRSWKESHVCDLNHDGSAGAMKPEGAVRTFHRSNSTRNLRYLEYLGDGDSASFLKVKASKPYGEDLITKSECIEHIQKRVGARLTPVGDEGSSFIPTSKRSPPVHKISKPLI